MSERTESEWVLKDAVHSCVIPGDHWMRKVEEGRTLRILDLEATRR